MLPAMTASSPLPAPGNPRDDAAAQGAVPYAAVTAISHRSEMPGRGLAHMLTAVAWLILSVGVVGTILSWVTISDVQAGMRLPIPENLGSFPLGLLLGLAYLAIGVLGFAFFWVSSLISRQLKDIHQLLLCPVPSPATAAKPGEDGNPEQA